MGVDFIFAPDYHHFKLIKTISGSLKTPKQQEKVQKS